MQYRLHLNGFSGIISLSFSSLLERGAFAHGYKFEIPEKA
jgi:hypothetical protein